MNPQDVYYPQQQQPISMPVTSDEIYASEIQREVVKNIVAQLDPENQLHNIEMRLRGFRKDTMTGQWVKINPNKPEPCPELIERYIGILAPIVSQSATLSFLSEKQVNMMMRGLIEWITDDLDNNSELYGLDTDFTERTRIGKIMCDSAFTSLTRAINGRESQRIFKAISLSEYNSGEIGGQKKKSFLDYFKM